MVISTILSNLIFWKIHEEPYSIDCHVGGSHEKHPAVSISIHGKIGNSKLKNLSEFKKPVENVKN